MPVWFILVRVGMLLVAVYLGGVLGALIDDRVHRRR
jgi:hypothetical protein